MLLGQLVSADRQCDDDFLTFIHRPTGGIALALLFFSLHLNPAPHGKTFKQHVSEFDFIGLVAILGGVVCVLLGFSQSEISCTSFTGWFIQRDTNYLRLLGNSPATIALLIVGFVLLVFAAGWECYTSRSPIIPPRLFKVRSRFVHRSHNSHSGYRRAPPL